MAPLERVELKETFAMVMESAAKAMAMVNATVVVGLMQRQYQLDRVGPTKGRTCVATLMAVVLQDPCIFCS